MEVLKQVVREAVRDFNMGQGATADQVVAFARGRLPQARVDDVHNKLEEGRRQKAFFVWVGPDGALLYGLEGSWVAEDAALSDFINLTMR